MLTITKVRFRLKLLFMILICSINLLAQQKKIPVCHVPVPSKKGIILAKSATKVALAKPKNTLGMVQIPGGTFQMGSHSKDGRSDEYPVHLVKLNGFWMDQTEVTNAQFQEFVQATGYVTTAERPIDWEEMKKQVPVGTPRPPDSLLEASSLVFTPTTGPVNLNDYSQWWQFRRGANWRHPSGPLSDIKGKENHPVVQVSWDDARAYAKWAGKRLPTEAEWEWAARGGLKNLEFPWGSESVDQGSMKANTWQGNFPYQDDAKDGYKFSTAPVKSYPANRFGLSDMAGNVWEWCSDNYRPDYYKQLATKVAVSPRGPQDSFDPDEPGIPKKVMRGGSFLCNDSYCASYRVAARMKSSPDSGLEHTGFRCVKNLGE